MSPPLPAEARLNDWRTAILSTVAEMLDLAAETMREHGIAAAGTQTDDAAWGLRVDDRTVLTVCAPASAPAASPVTVRADGVSAWASVALASDVIGPQVGAECRAAKRRDAIAALARYAARRDGPVTPYKQAPKRGPWAGLARRKGQVLAVVWRGAVRGQPDELRCSVESLSIEEFMRHLGVSRHEAQRIREKALEDGL